MYRLNRFSIGISFDKFLRSSVVFTLICLVLLMVTGSADADKRASADKDISPTELAEFKATLSRGERTDGQDQTENASARRHISFQSGAETKYYVVWVQVGTLAKPAFGAMLERSFGEIGWYEANPNWTKKTGGGVGFIAKQWGKTAGNSETLTAKFDQDDTTVEFYAEGSSGKKATLDWDSATLNMPSDLRDAIDGTENQFDDFFAQGEASGSSTIIPGVSSNPSKIDNVKYKAEGSSTWTEISGWGNAYAPSGYTIQTSGSQVLIYKNY